MTALVLGTLFFVCLHLFVSGTTLRDRLTAALGERAYLALFSIASTAGIVWMCAAYARAPYVHLWNDPPVMALVATWVTMPIAFLLAVVGITTPSPTAMGGERLLASESPATGILRITRHPFLWGVALWAATHFLANGDAASLVFFGGFLVLTLYGPVSIDHKRARRLGGKWAPFAQVTSNVPFAAIASGRNHLALGEIAVWRVLAAAAAYAVLYLSHDALFG